MIMTIQKKVTITKIAENIKAESPRLVSGAFFLPVVQ